MTGEGLSDRVSEGQELGNTEEFTTLSETLTILPPATPLFIPEEFLEEWFGPWVGANGPSKDNVKSAEDFAAQFGCTFTYDDFMKSWCFTKQPTSN